MEKRIHIIDGMRGFSLFGILLANLLIFQYGLWGKDEIHLFPLSPLDKNFYAFTKIAIESSFMPIFTFLFGYSMMMMRERFAHNNLRIKWHLFRRSCLLVIIGILHATFLWDGDILLLYGVMGLFLLVFVNRKAKTLLIWGSVLFLAIAFLNLYPTEDEELLEPALLTSYIHTTTEVYQTGSYSEITTYRNHSEDPLSQSMSEGEIGAILLLMPFTIAPMFLFGMYAAKRGFFRRPQQEKRHYLIGAVIGLILGLGMKAYGYFLAQTSFVMIGGIILAFGYISLIGLLYSKFPTSRLVMYFEQVGKLSLTNYIFQTVICTTVFYGYGFGLFGKVGVFEAMLFGILIFVMQIAFSCLYIKYFRYGPLEKIVRIGTYLSFSNKPKKRKGARKSSSEQNLLNEL
ncbi:DUF418 domain-containing protein [Sporosarcina soli]|uniref:DUF418 domain-containing protein n=1 Tax=Sporosarcina soli TaxID=334736 RepID=A0ABW0TIE9_9BACL